MKTKSPPKQAVSHTVQPESEIELRGQDSTAPRFHIPDVEQIPSLIVSLFDQILAEQRRSVELAHDIGRLLLHARRELRSDYKNWLANNIHTTIGARQCRKYSRLAGHTKSNGSKISHWQAIQSGVKNNKFGTLDSQFNYTIDGCLRYLSSTIGKRKGSRKSDSVELKKLKVKRATVLKVLDTHKITEDAFNELLLELGYMVYDTSPKTK